MKKLSSLVNWPSAPAKRLKRKMFKRNGFACNYSSRTSSGVELLDRENSILPLARRLHANRPVAVLNDQYAGRALYGYPGYVRQHCAYYCNQGYGARFSLGVKKIDL